jgi:hypothetical protein
MINLVKIFRLVKIMTGSRYFTIKIKGREIPNLGVINSMNYLGCKKINCNGQYHKINDPKKILQVKLFIS